MRLDRRAAIGGAVALAGCATARAPAPPPPLGLADITVIKELSRDYAGTLRRVAAMGYTTMGFRLRSFGGPQPGEPTPQDKARLVRAAGMALGVVRLGVRNVDYDRDLADAAEIGATVVAMTTAPPFISGPRLHETTREQFDAWLPQLAAIAEKAKARRLTLAYHNHWYDLAPLGGEAPLELMARAIPPELLSFEIDLAWSWYAGVAPLDLIARLGPRVVSMHWKDIDRARGKNPTEHAVAPGYGEMDYAALIPRIRRLTRAIPFVEVDNPDDGLAAAADAFRFVRGVEARSGQAGA